MIAALILIAGVILVGAVFFWPGKRSPSGDSNNPFFIGDVATFKRRKTSHRADSGILPSDTSSVGNSHDGSGH